ncbi:hypothetical protein GO755_32890 [Spirosoma sp. HMF4905]|uniref:Uncharacterized protein n=1 Tax=Spirosoma arboris TaxID=2682092 RepID=A0A7K1SM40_9BACT|nr:hypothetical protein [Spirosoma arboris]MVM34872.1 hypothetical protein [Spirosoma arboris]
MNDRLGRLNDGGYNNLLAVALVVLVIYLFISGFNKSKQQAYLDNAGLDKTTQMAQALRDAMNRSGIKLMMSVDGTDLDLVMSTAALITDYKAVSDAYRVLYGSELTTDLQEELTRDQLQQFWNVVYKTNATTTPTTTNPTSNVGKTVTAIQTSNIRADVSPYEVVVNILGQRRQASAGQVLGKYVSERLLPDLPNKGDKLTFVKYEESAFFGTYTVPYWVLKSAVKIA